MQRSDFSFFYHLEKAIKTYRQFAQSRFREHGHDITIDQWLLLRLLNDNPELSQNELAGMVFKDKASITRIIDLLVEKGYVERASDQANRRRNRLLITPSGQKVIDSLTPIVAENRRTALAEASDAEIAGFVRAVGKVAREAGAVERGYRLLANTGPDSHQQVPHLHVHIFAGRPLGPMLAG